MRRFTFQRTGVRRATASIAAISIFAVCLAAQPGQPAKEAPGLSPRVAATDYQANAAAGEVTIGAEFTGHAIPTAQGPLNSEDYVAVEVAIFGPADKKVKISVEDFSLRIGGKKQALSSQPFTVVFRSLKDPEYEPPTPVGEKKSKTGIGTGGGDKDSPPPSPPPIPIEVRRAMQQRVQKSALPEGDRLLPQAGLLFYQYRGKTGSLPSIELIYNGPAGKCSLALQ